MDFSRVTHHANPLAKRRAVADHHVILAVRFPAILGMVIAATWAIGF
jgi:hypothetical protein